MHELPTATQTPSHSGCRATGPERAHEGRLLIVDDNRRAASQTAQRLCRRGFHASAVATAAEAVYAMDREAFDACLLAHDLPGSGTREVQRAVSGQRNKTALILLVPHGDRRGCDCHADATLEWPNQDERLLKAVATARQQILAQQRTAAVRQSTAMVGEHARLREVLDIVSRVAHTPATILITGETGTGKSRLARAIHEMGSSAGRRTGRFVEVACGAVSESLLESELFGHVAGAFTGAVRDRDGRFREADGGTIFLDEIATASPAMQVKLLRVLQEQRFEPVGGGQTFQVDVRVVLATHEDLAARVAEGRFREDLFWRINVVEIEMPPLRVRGDDILLLAHHFLCDAERMAGREVRGFSSAAREALLTHDWPGNVRELEHAVRRAVLLGRGHTVDVHDLPESLRAASRSSNDQVSGATLKNALEVPERQIILDALARHGWCRHAAARELGINRTSLYKKFKRLGIDPATLGSVR